MLNLILNLRKYSAYRPRNQFNARERLAGALAYPAYARTPLFDSEKGLKCAHFSLISTSRVSLAATFRSLFSVCLRSQYVAQ
jgi:hypothetical protein